MPEIDRAEVQAAWQALSRRYGWSLVDDEAALIARALAECQTLTVKGSAHDWAKVGVWRTYGALMCAGLRTRDERAAAELWRMFAYMAMSRGAGRMDAEEVAQEAVVRVLVKLPSLQSPQGFLTWALRLFGTVWREQHSAAETFSDEPPEHETADERDLALDVEQRLVASDLIAQLRARLANALELQVLLRTVLLGEKPREIAVDLHLPPHRIRLAKSRAFGRLREDPTLLAWLRDLTGDAALALGSLGAVDNDE